MATWITPRASLSSLDHGFFNDIQSTPSKLSSVQKYGLRGRRYGHYTLCGYVTYEIHRIRHYMRNSRSIHCLLKSIPQSPARLPPSLCLFIAFLSTKVLKYDQFFLLVTKDLFLTFFQKNCRKSFKRFFHFGMAGSSANSNMNQTGTSETPALKRNSKDVAWEYGMLCNPSNPDKVKCKLCGKLFSGGAFRIKEHIAKIPGNVSACPLSTKDDQEKCKNAIDEAKKKKKSKRSSDADLRNSVKICDVGDEDDEAGAELEELRSKKIPRTLGPMDKCASDINPRLSSVETRQQNISDALCKDRLHKVHQYIGRWVFASGVPFHATANDEFKLMLEAVGQFGSGVTPPSQYLLREPLLKEEVAAEYNLHAKPKHSTDNVNMSKID
ncbi:hypothetical protein YC2023_098419 [Brassica napus]